MPDKFRLTNPQWQKFLSQIVKTVEEELGLEEQLLESYLYNLLLYEKGSFFLPHQDGEKLDRMVATLVVVLPSAFEGGELIIRHEGREEIIDFSKLENSNFLTHYAAFYADCEHEVKPLNNGYRLCLVYNLTLEKSQKSIYAPHILQHIQDITSILHQWSNTHNSQDQPLKLAITLNHQYSQSGLIWDALKGIDRARAQILSEAAKQANCKAYLSLLTFWQSGSAEYSGDGMDYYDRGNGWNASDFDMEDVYDSHLTAQHLLDDTNQPLDIGNGTMFLEENEVIPEGSLTDTDPEEEVDGFTGNEGLTIERWYRRSAILLWPAKHHFQVLCNSGINSAINGLDILIQQWQNAIPEEKSLLKDQCLEFARIIINKWQPATIYRGSEQKIEPCKLLPILEVLENPNLIQSFLAQVVSKDASIELSIPVLKFCEKKGWPLFQNQFLIVFRNRDVDFLNRNIRLLEQFCSKELLKDKEWIGLCRLMIDEIIQTLRLVDGSKNDSLNKTERSIMLAGFARSLITTEQSETLAWLIDYTLERPKLYTVTPVLVQTLIGMHDWVSENIKQPCIILLSKWLAACCNHLESLTAQIPERPADFHRPAIIACKCADCKELIDFLNNPNEKIHYFRVRKDRRQHLHQIIEKHQCDLEHVTERTGSPQTLVCTKNTASFERKLKQYHKNKEDLAMFKSSQTLLLKV